MIPLMNQLNAESLIDSLPGLIWVKNTDLQYILCNEKLRRFTGFSQKTDLIGRDDYNVAWADYADIYRTGDQQILTEQKTLNFLHPCRLPNGNQLIIVTRKSPYYDLSQKINGIVGSISIVTAHNVVNNLFDLSKFDISLSSHHKQSALQYVLADKFEHFNLTKREVTCLFYVVRGKTAREIARILVLSKRTIEKHIDNIRIKLNCKSKSEMISKAIDCGFVNFIPSDLFINAL